MRGLERNVPIKRQGSRSEDMLMGVHAEPDVSPLLWIKGNKGHLVQVGNIFKQGQVRDEPMRGSEGAGL